jgi:hypothetical protein
MGIICFEGDQPYELLLARDGKARVIDEIVEVILPVLVPGPEPQEREIRVLMRISDARSMARKMIDAVDEAARRAREGE